MKDFVTTWWPPVRAALAICFFVVGGIYLWAHEAAHAVLADESRLRSICEKAKFYGWTHDEVAAELQKGDSFDVTVEQLGAIVEVSAQAQPRGMLPSAAVALRYRNGKLAEWFVYTFAGPL